MIVLQDTFTRFTFTIGTVKIAFFFDLMKRPLVDDLEAAEPASSSVQEQYNVERAGSESSD